MFGIGENTETERMAALEKSNAELRAAVKVLIAILSAPNMGGHIMKFGGHIQPELLPFIHVPTPAEQNAEYERSQRERERVAKMLARYDTPK